MKEEGKIVIIENQIEETEILKEELFKYLGQELFVFKKFQRKWFEINNIDLLFLATEGIDDECLEELIKLQMQKEYKINIILLSNDLNCRCELLSIAPVFLIHNKMLKQDLKEAFACLDKRKFRKNN